MANNRVVAMPVPTNVYDAADIKKHNNARDCWIVVEGKVYDVTDFLKDHPGGPAVILKYAGRDATEAYNEIHDINLINDHIEKDKHLGDVSPQGLQELQLPPEKEQARGDTDEAKSVVPHITLCCTAEDFEAPAKHTLSNRSWIYVSSSANNTQSLRNNLKDWSRITYRPRILRDVSEIDLSTELLGQKCAYPFFACPMGAMGLMHPEGEVALARGTASKKVSYVVSTAATKPFEAISETYHDQQETVDAAGQSHLYFQLYVNSKREVTQALLQRIRTLGFKGLCITVDTAIIGKRTADRYLQAQEALDAGVADFHDLVEQTDRPTGGGRSRPGTITPALNWSDLDWIRKEWDGPVMLKGIQTAEDAKLAYEHGCHIWLSNHGGRQLHSAPSNLSTLIEIHNYCPEIIGKCEIWLDGGCRHGADITKALCLGATAVGLGRPFAYAVATYGSAGAARLIDILTEEMKTTMMLLGANTIKDLKPELVNTTELQRRMWQPNFGKGARL